MAQAQAQTTATGPATHAGTQVPADAHPAGFPPFRTETFAGQLVWFAIAFGLLYYVMSKVALPKVGAILHDRTLRIAGDLDEAQAMRAQSETAIRAYESSLAEARGRAKSIAQETRDTLTAEADARRKTVEAELAGKLAGAEATIRSRTESAMSSVRGIAAEAAGAIVEQLTGRAPEPAALEAALDRTMRS